MSGGIGGRSRAHLTKGGVLAAATVVAGVGVLGVAAPGPQLPVASAAVVQGDGGGVALAAYPTFTESLQSLLDVMQLGTVNDVLALLGAVPGDPDTNFSVGSTVGQLLQALNPDGMTLGQTFAMFGIPLGDPLYSTNGESLLGSTTFSIGGQVVDNPFVFNAPPSFYTTVWPGDSAGNLYSSINGTPLGNVDLGQLVDLLLGGAGQGDEHSLADLVDQLGFNLNQALPSFGGLTDLFGWLSGLNTYGDALAKLADMLSNYNVVENDCVLGVCGNTFAPQALSINSSLNDWLSGLLQMATTDVTRINHHSVLAGGGTTTTVLADTAKSLGEYLQTVPWGTTANTFLGGQSLADLLGMNPDMTWSAYLSTMMFGGIFFHPGTEGLGSETLGDMLLGFLPGGGSGFDLEGGDADVTDLLVALGFLMP